MKRLALLLLLPISACAIAAEPPAPAPAPPKACTAAEYRQFDFWIGEWEVTNPDGTPAGHNRIERIEGECALQENWTSATGGSGRSLNTWDTYRKVWHQTWVDRHGTLLQLDGGLSDGNMVLKGEHKGQLNRITWTPNKDASVTQHWEVSADNGKTWTTLFNGLYRKTALPE